MAASNVSEIFEIEADDQNEHFSRPTNAESVVQDEDELVWAAIERLPSQKRSNYAIMTEAVDVRKLDQTGRELLLRQAMATNEQDNCNLLSGVQERLNRVGLKVPTFEVRFEGLNISADIQIGHRALPTLINYTRDTIESCLTLSRIFHPKRHLLTILNSISGHVKPGRMTLLLGPPASGKTTFLKALAGKLDHNLRVSGKITYNGHNLDEFCYQRTAAYISQTDNHIGELTVRETLDFAVRCQGASDGFAGYLKELAKLEKQKNIRPSPVIDAFMKASSVQGKKQSLATDYILRVLGLDVCAETLVGSDMVMVFQVAKENA